MTHPRTSRRHRLAWWTVAILSWIVVAYGSLYLWIAWVSWVPNVIVAEWYIRSLRTRGVFFAGAPLTERPTSS